MSTIKQQQLKGSSGGAKKSKSLSLRKRTPVKIRAEDIFSTEKPPASPQTSLENNKPLTIDVEDVDDKQDDSLKKEKDDPIKKEVPKDTKVNFGSVSVKIEEPVVKVKNLDEVRVSQVTADNIDSAEELISQALSDWRKHKSSTSSPSVNGTWKKSRSTTSAQVFSILKGDKEAKDDSAVGKVKPENLGEIKKKKRSSMLVDKNELINEEKGEDGDKENDENHEEDDENDEDVKKRRKRTFSLRFSGKGRIELKGKLDAQAEAEKDKSPAKKRNKESSEVLLREVNERLKEQGVEGITDVEKNWILQAIKQEEIKRGIRPAKQSRKPKLKHSESKNIETKSEIKPESKSESKSEAKSESKSEAKAESKGEGKGEPKEPISPDAKRASGEKEGKAALTDSKSSESSSKAGSKIRLKGADSGKVSRKKVQQNRDVKSAAQLEQQIQLMQLNLNEINRKYENMLKEKDLAVEKCEQLQETNGQLEQQVIELRHVKSELGMKLNLVSATSEERDKAIQELEQKMSKKVAKMSERESKMATQLKQSISAQSKLETQLMQLRCGRTNLEQERSDVLMELDKANKTIEKLKQANGFLKAEIQVMKSTKENLEKRANQDKEDLVEAYKYIDMLEESDTQLRTAILLVQKQNKALYGINQHLKEQLSEAQANLAMQRFYLEQGEDEDTKEFTQEFWEETRVQVIPTAPPLPDDPQPVNALSNIPNYVVKKRKEREKAASEMDGDPKLLTDMAEVFAKALLMRRVQVMESVNTDDHDSEWDSD